MQTLSLARTLNLAVQSTQARPLLSALRATALPAQQHLARRFYSVDANASSSSSPAPPPRKDRFEAPHFNRRVEDVPPHALGAAGPSAAAAPAGPSYSLPHPIWSEEEVNAVSVTHRKPENVIDWIAYGSVSSLRISFDLLSGYYGTMDEGKWLKRIIFLETIAGVPGMVAAMVRHLHSLRNLKRDHGFIHTLLEEAENERMHLLVAMRLRKPSALFRACVIGAQGVFVGWFSLAYLISPRFCHRFVGYLEESACITYTKCLVELDAGRLPLWEKLPAPTIAKEYWKLKQDAMFRDVLLAIRADEASHRNVNHEFASLHLKEGETGVPQKNPFGPGKTH